MIKLKVKNESIFYIMFDLYQFKIQLKEIDIRYKKIGTE
jgi:hypothetical protein